MKRPVKNVAYFCESLLALGGAERSFSYISKARVKGVRKYIILFDAKTIDLPFDGEIVNLDLPRPPYKNIFQALYVLAKGALKLRRIKKEKDISVCFSLKEWPNIINVLSGSSKVIVSVREHKSGGLRGKKITGHILKALMKFFYNRADYVVANSKAGASDLITNFGIREEKVEVLYNVCDVSLISKEAKQDIPAQYKDIFSKPVIISVGRISREKCHWHLIRAFSVVKKQMKDARLVIIGGGEEEPYLKKIIKAMDLSNEVFLLGYKSSPARYISKAQLFVLTSAWEGFGNVLIEAMACKVPVLSVDCKAGPRELLAPESDIDSVASSVEYARYGALVLPLDGEYKKIIDPLTKEELILADSIVALLGNNELCEKYARLGYTRALDFNIGSDAQINKIQSMLD